MSDHFQPVNPHHFQKMIRKGKKSRSKNSWMVDVHKRFTDSDGKGYAQMRCYLTKDGKSGFAITKDGDLVSVFSRSGKKGALDRIIPTAVALGARKLDCYGGGLQNMYARFGAEPTGKTNFMRKYAPKDWTGRKADKPKLVAMILPSSLYEIENKYNLNAQVDMKRVRQFGSYDTMIADRNLKLRNRNESVLKESIVDFNSRGLISG